MSELVFLLNSGEIVNKKVPLFSMKYLKLTFRFWEMAKDRHVKLKENNDWEITVWKNNNLKPIINGQPIFSLRSNVHENTCC